MADARAIAAAPHAVDRIPVGSADVGRCGTELEFGTCSTNDLENGRLGGHVVFPPFECLSAGCAPGRPKRRPPPTAADSTPSAAVLDSVHPGSLPSRAGGDRDPGEIANEGLLRIRDIRGAYPVSAPYVAGAACIQSIQRRRGGNGKAVIDQRRDRVRLPLAGALGA